MMNAHFLVLSFSYMYCFHLQVLIFVTFYSALTIETASLANFGLTGIKLGVFLVCVNVLVVAIVVCVALDKYRLQRRERAMMESKVLVHKLILIFMYVCTYINTTNYFSFVAQYGFVFFYIIIGEYF